MKIHEIPGMVVEPSIYVNDYKNKRRGWLERLFGRPWNPIKKYVTVYDPTAYVIGNTMIVSPRSYEEMRTHSGAPRSS